MNLWGWIGIGSVVKVALTGALVWYKRDFIRRKIRSWTTRGRLIPVVEKVNDLDHQVRVIDAKMTKPKITRRPLTEEEKAARQRDDEARAITKRTEQARQQQAIEHVRAAASAKRARLQPPSRGKTSPLVTDESPLRIHLYEGPVPVETPRPKVVAELESTYLQAPSEGSRIH